MPLAFHPDSGALVYSPATDQLALDCLEGRTIPDCETCPSTCTCYAQTYSLQFAGIDLCEDCVENLYTGPNYIHVLDWDLDTDAKCMDEEGGTTWDCRWGANPSELPFTSWGTITYETCSDAECADCYTQTDMPIYGAAYASATSELDRKLVVWLYAEGGAGGADIALFKGSIALPADTPEPDAAIENDWGVGDCGSLGEVLIGTVMGYGGTATVLACCELLP